MDDATSRIVQAEAQAQFGELFRQVELFLGVFIAFSALCLAVIALMYGALLLKERAAGRAKEKAASGD